MAERKSAKGNHWIYQTEEYWRTLALHLWYGILLLSSISGRKYQKKIKTGLEKEWKRLKNIIRT
jgi:hypothetical protein